MSRIPQDELERLRADKGLLIETVEALGGRCRDDGKVHCPNKAGHANGDQTASAGLRTDESGGVRFKCFACGLSGDVFDLWQRVGGLSFVEAVERLRDGNGNGSRAVVGKSKPSPGAGELRTARQIAEQAHRALMADSQALAHLWRTRGIDKAVAERFGLGIRGEPGDRHWVMPICTPTGDFVAFKAHRADGQSRKAWWNPQGVSRVQVWPVHLESQGPVWVCPGELKGLAVISAGGAAIAITSGEDVKNGLPAKAIELLRGRAAVIPADNDEQGMGWAETTRGQLEAGGIEARLVDMGQYVHERGGDIGAWIVSLIQDGKDTEAIRASLDHAYEQADPWRPFRLATIWAAPKTWEPAGHIPTGFTALDESLGGGLRMRAVHLLVGHPGQTRTQTAVQIAANAARRGEPTGLLSLELARDEIGQLVAGQIGGVARGRLARGELQQHELDQLKWTVSENGAMPLVILDDDYWLAGLDRTRLAEIVAAGCRQFKWRLVLVDYIGLLAKEEADRSEYESDLLNSAVFRRIARQNDIALVAVSALRKPTGAQAEKDVALSDVLGAGRLGYDSTTVIAIRAKQEPGTAGHPRGTVTLHILKSRFSGAMHGEPVSLTWHPGWGRIENEEGAM